MVTMLKSKCSVWKRIKFPTFWYNCYYFTWSDTYFIQLETLLTNHPSYMRKITAGSSYCGVCKCVCGTCTVAGTHCSLTLTVNCCNVANWARHLCLSHLFTSVRHRRCRTGAVACQQRCLQQAGPALQQPPGTCDISLAPARRVMLLWNLLKVTWR